MTNRRRLQNKSMYDILFEQNKEMLTDFNDYQCIMEFIEKKHKLNFLLKRCFTMATEDKCSRCISAWLNKEEL